MYLGRGNGITAPYTLVGIDSLGRFTSSIGIKWEAFLDSSITFNRIDSIFFKVFSVDSSISGQMLPSLYFSSTFDFDEDSITNSILDGNFVSPDWILIGLPLMASLLFINIGLGVITRAAPSLNIFAVGFPAMILAGMVLLSLSMTSIGYRIQWLWNESFEIVGQALGVR